MNYHSHRYLTVDDSSRKRKDRQDTFYSSPKPSNPLTAVSKAAPEPNNTKMANPLLAGYLAYEFLTKGTLLGQKYDPARAKAVPVNANVALAEPKKRKLNPEEGEKSKPKPKPKNESYAEVAALLRSDGTHIPGIVNPTQLAQWIQM